MALREHFETSGAWLFRWRSYLPLILFAVLLLGVQRFHYPSNSHSVETAYELGCFAFGLIGLLIRAHSVGHAAPGTSGRITRKQEADALNTTGMYSIVRHPLYLGNYIMWISGALLSRNIWVVLVVTLAFWLYYERIMSAEEAFLRGKFGGMFETWAGQTPAFLPSLKLWQKPKFPFDLSRIMRRERSSLLGLITTFTLFAVYVDSRIAGELRIDTLWAVMMGIGLVLYTIGDVQRRIERRTRKQKEHG